MRVCMRVCADDGAGWLVILESRSQESILQQSHQTEHAVTSQRSHAEDLISFVEVQHAAQLNYSKTMTPRRPASLGAWHEGRSQS